MLMLTSSLNNRRRAKSAAMVVLSMGLALVGCNRTESPEFKSPDMHYDHAHEHVHGPGIHHDHEHPGITSIRHSHPHTHPERN